MHEFERLIPHAASALGLSEEQLVRAFRPAAASDLHGILALRRAVVPDMWWDDEAFARWRYFGRTLPGGITPYWIVLHEDEIVAACGLEPVTLVVDGSPLEAVRTLDIMVRPELDGRGLGAFMNLMLFRHFPVALVTGCNAASRNLISRLFQHTADLVFWKTVMTSHDVISERLYAGPFSRVLAAGADLLLQWRRWRREIVSPAGLVIRELKRFDDRATELSQRCERRGRVVVRRSAAHLNWRFVENPRCRYRVHGAFTGERLDGYVVSRLNLSRPNPRREGEIVDWMAYGDPADAQSPLPSLLAAALGGLAQDGATLVTCAAYGADVAEAAAANGFHLREQQRIPFFVRASAPGLHERLTSGGGWFLTRGDLDVE